MMDIEKTCELVGILNRERGIVDPETYDKGVELAKKKSKLNSTNKEQMEWLTFLNECDQPCQFPKEAASIGFIGKRSPVWMPQSMYFQMFGCGARFEQSLERGVLYVAVLSHPALLGVAKAYFGIDEIEMARNGEWTSNVLTVSPDLVDKNEETREAFAQLIALDGTELIFDERELEQVPWDIEWKARETPDRFLGPWHPLAIAHLYDAPTPIATSYIADRLKKTVSEHLGIDESKVKIDDLSDLLSPDETEQHPVPDVSGFEIEYEDKAVSLALDIESAEDPVLDSILLPRAKDKEQSIAFLADFIEKTKEMQETEKEAPAKEEELSLADRIKKELREKIEWEYDEFNAYGMLGYADSYESFEDFADTPLEELGSDIEKVMQSFPEIKQWKVASLLVQDYADGGALEIHIDIAWVAEGVLDNANVEFMSSY